MLTVTGLLRESGTIWGIASEDTASHETRSTVHGHLGQPVSQAPQAAQSQHWSHGGIRGRLMAPSCEPMRSARKRMRNIPVMSVKSTGSAACGQLCRILCAGSLATDAEKEKRAQCALRHAS
jgi:hypothetical protein